MDSICLSHSWLISSSLLRTHCTHPGETSPWNKPMIDGSAVMGTPIFSRHFPSSAGENSIHLHAVFNYTTYHRAALQSRFTLKSIWEQKQATSAEKNSLKVRKKAQEEAGLRGESRCPAFGQKHRYVIGKHWEYSSCNAFRNYNMWSWFKVRGYCWK